jgi:hypothetical protein
MPPADSLTEEVARLYALAPGEFVAARNAAAKAWKQAGRKDEAAALGALRKPSVVEGALNRTAHRDPVATRAWADATRRADEAQSATIGGADAAALRTAVGELRTATAAMVDAAVDTMGDERKRDDIAAYLRTLPVGGASQVVAGVLGSEVLPEEDLFAGAPTPPRRARPKTGAPKPPARTAKATSSSRGPASTPPPAPPGPSARQRKLQRTVEQRRDALAALDGELDAARQDAEAAQRKLAGVERRRDAAAASLTAAEGELAAETAGAGR